jgi:hypothetical protein
MKKAISTLTLSTLVLMSCSNPVEELTDTAVNEIRKGLLDPNSMEVIETSVDTLNLSWLILREAQPIKGKSDMWQNLADDYKYKAIWDETGVYRNAQIEALDSVEHYLDLYIDELEKVKAIQKTDKDEVVGYGVFVRYYAVNRGGDRAIGETRYYSLLTGETFTEQEKS